MLSTLRMSGLLDELEQYFHSPTGEPLWIYGDPAYPERIWLQTPYRDAHVTLEPQQYRASMSTVKMAVEWVFGDKLTYFALMDYKKDLKIGLSPVNKMYTISTLLRNALTSWLYGNTSTFFSTFFHITPPTIQDYFQI